MLSFGRIEHDKQIKIRQYDLSCYDNHISLSIHAAADSADGPGLDSKLYELHFQKGMEHYDEGDQDLAPKSISPDNLSQSGSSWCELSTWADGT